ncbi:MAG: hypothetical protein DCC71_12455 [Proteobacteria bacterium]|nr:MAG: hypothetical protein DCC71_12455 [Pseudomonadota bacterium]
MRIRVLLALVLLSAAASPAVGAEFVPGWDAEAVYDTNVFQTRDEDQFGRKIPKEDDFSLRTGPNLRIREKQGDLRYDVGYQLRYEEYARLDGISEFDHFADARGEWVMDDLTTFSLSDSFGYSSSLGGLFEAGLAGAAPIVIPARVRVTTNQGLVGMRRRLGPRWELTLNGQSDYYSFSGESDSSTDSSSHSMSGVLQVTRSLSRRLVAGFGGQFQRQTFDNGDVAPETSTDIYQGFGLLQYQFSRTLRFSANVGPAWSKADAVDVGDLEEPSYVPVDLASCPRREDGAPFTSQAQAAGFQTTGPRCNFLVFQDQAGRTFFPLRAADRIRVPFVGETEAEGQLSYFGRLSLDKQWSQWRGTLSYSRSASNGSGLGVSTIVDNLSGELTWTPTRHWTLKLLGGVSMQSAISELRVQQVALRPAVARIPIVSTDGIVTTTLATVGVPFEISSGDEIDNPIDVRTFRVELRGTRRISRNLTADASASYYQQKSSSDFADAKRNYYRVIVGVTWTFDPIPL